MLWASFIFGSGAQAQTIDYVNAIFSVEYNNQLTQGENRLNIQRDDTTYEVDFVLDHWLLSARQTATFDMEQCKVEPASYVAVNKRPFKQETTETLQFDRSQNTAEYRSEDEQKTFDVSERLYDPISLFFEARCELMQGKKDFSYPLIRKGNKTTHVYKVTGTETVETGEGPVEAMVVERERRSTKRHTRLYVAPELDYLLVKIEHREGRMVNIVATLQDLDYELVQ